MLDLLDEMSKFTESYNLLDLRSKTAGKSLACK